ncbi:MAG: hypothetical protein F6K07_32335 [Okeania sp. SIO1H5]|uniref:hypothetical protein n=1 Tax=Okeania sp. SIO1H5 TaxID=2607777 RepID=UPI0013B92518|nr:hypothetical protein [Okeania sp. SIO1H5]NET23694.1 hypothetical protein [Okeania sp. SIO1H5]
MALSGDPELSESENRRVESLLQRIERLVPRILDQGFGDRGWYAEGVHPGRISANTGLLELLMALRCARGRDYFATRPNAHWITLRWVMELLENEGRPTFPNRGTYGDRHCITVPAMLSHCGDFALGFGSVPDSCKPALQWAYETIVERSELAGTWRPFWQEPGKRSFNIFVYPHHALHVLLHWPIGQVSQNPSAMMPKTIVDTTHGYFCTRPIWRDNQDCIVTFYLNLGPRGFHAPQKCGVLTIWFQGMRFDWSTGLAKAVPVWYRAREDGSFAVRLYKEHELHWLIVDTSGESGATLVIIAKGRAFEPQASQPGLDPTPRLKTSDSKTDPIYLFASDPVALSEAIIGSDEVQVGPQTIRLSEVERLFG